MDFNTASGPWMGGIPTRLFDSSGYRPLSPDEIPLLREPEHRWWDNFLAENSRALEDKRELRSSENPHVGSLPALELAESKLETLGPEENRPIESIVPPSPLFSAAAERAYLSQLVDARGASEDSSPDAHSQDWLGRHEIADEPAAHPGRRSCPDTFAHANGGRPQISRPAPSLESLARNTGGAYETRAITQMRTEPGASTHGRAAHVPLPQGTARSSSYSSLVMPKYTARSGQLPRCREPLSDLSRLNELDRIARSRRDAIQSVYHHGDYTRFSVASVSKRSYRFGNRYRP